MSNSDENIKDVLAQFLGQTYSELHKIDKNIVGASNNLSYKSDEFKRVAAQVLNAPEHAQGTQRVVAPVMQPVIQHQQAASPAPVVDPGQLEFNFDNSPTAKNILAAIQRIESKVDAVERKLIKLLDSRKK